MKQSSKPETLADLKAYIDQIAETSNWENLDKIALYITLAENSIGSRAYETVRCVGMGIDWEHNQFRIEPTQNLVHKGNSIQDAKSIVCRPYDGRNYYWCPTCQGRVSKGDRYCRACGQKLNS